MVFLTDDIGKKLPVSEYKCIYPGEIPQGLRISPQQVSSPKYLTGKDVQK